MVIGFEHSYQLTLNSSRTVSHS